MLATIRDVRGEGDKDRAAATSEDFAGTDVHDDIDLTLVEMQSDVLGKIDAAIRRLEQGRYGRCIECHGTIAPERLRAMPFALRCLQCELARESETRGATQRRQMLSRLHGSNWDQSHETMD